METTAIDKDISFSSNAQEAHTAAKSNNVIELLPQEAEMETQCEGGVCMLAWKPQRSPRTAA